MEQRRHTLPRLSSPSQRPEPPRSPPLPAPPPPPLQRLPNASFQLQQRRRSSPTLRRRRGRSAPTRRKTTLNLRRKTTTRASGPCCSCSRSRSGSRARRNHLPVKRWECENVSLTETCRAAACLSHTQARKCWGRWRGRGRTLCSTGGWSQEAAIPPASQIDSTSKEEGRPTPKKVKGFVCLLSVNETLNPKKV